MMMRSGGDGVDWKAMYVQLVEGSSAGDYVIPSDVTKINNNKFVYMYHMTSVYIPDSVYSIGTGAFSSTRFSQIRISHNPRLTSIPANFCAYNEHLTSVEIPANISKINNMAFYGCKGLQWVKLLPTTPPTWGNNCLGAATLTFPIYVPDESLEAYKTATGWSNYADRYKPLSEFVGGGNT